MLGYCMRCKMKTEISAPEPIVMRNGRPAVRGVCSQCGAKVFRIVSAPEQSLGDDAARQIEIRKIAYSIWEREGCRHGHDREHWITAEAIWREEHAKTSNPSEGL